MRSGRLRPHASTTECARGGVRRRALTTRVLRVLDYRVSAVCLRDRPQRATACLNERQHHLRNDQIAQRELRSRAQTRSALRGMVYTASQARRQRASMLQSVHPRALYPRVRARVVVRLDDLGRIDRLALCSRAARDGRAGARCRATARKPWIEWHAAASPGCPRRSRMGAPRAHCAR